MKTKIALVFIILLALVLRFYKIDINPPGLYIDEVSSGYNGYTILTQGVDEHGVSFPIWFKAFGEYKMPGLIYSIAGSMAIFGKNEFAVRFPSALTGVGTVILLFFITNRLLTFDKTHSKKTASVISLVSAFLLAISPWHIQFSRGGFDATIALFLYMLGVYLFTVFYQTQNKVALLVSIVSFALTLYMYNAYRITTGVTIILVAYILYRLFKQKKIQRNLLLLSVIVISLLSIPVLQFSFSEQGLTRFSQTSAFSEYKAESTLEKMSLYPLVFMRNYMSAFSPQFLFNFGDGIGRHQIPNFGVLPKWELPFILLGGYYLIQKRKTAFSKVILVLLVIFPLAGAVAAPSPHSLRDLPLVIPFSVLAALGLVTVFQIKNKKRMGLLFALSLVALFEYTYYLHYYYAHYPNVNLLDWGAGFKETVQKSTKYSKEYPHIVVDQNISFAGIYYKFYDDSLRPLFVGPDWKKPKEWGDERVLYVRPFYGEKTNSLIFDSVYLTNPNKDIFVQFWKL